MVETQSLPRPSQQADTGLPSSGNSFSEANRLTSYPSAALSFESAYAGSFAGMCSGAEPCLGWLWAACGSNGIGLNSPRPSTPCGGLVLSGASAPRNSGRVKITAARDLMLNVMIGLFLLVARAPRP